VFALIVWTLERAFFPSQDHGLSKASLIRMAVGAAAVFFGSRLAAAA
jgi:hypothetical protein